MKSKSRRVAFIFSQFPCYDEVFMLREMARLKKYLEIAIFSIRPAHKDPVQHPEALALKGLTVYSGLFFNHKLIYSNLKTLLGHPKRYLHCLLEIFKMSWPDPGLMLRSLAVFPQAVYFSRICFRQQIEAVHGQWATYPAVTARVISLINNIPFSFTGHAHDIYVKIAGLRYKLDQAAFVVTCTSDNVSHLSQINPQISPEKIRVIHHGVDLKKYYPCSKKAEKNIFKILSVGSLFKCKGFEYLIEACRLLNQDEIPFKCRIVGGGYLESPLKQQVANSGLNDLVEFSGYQSQARMPEHYRWGDIFILPAVLKIHWGIPNVLLESLACGVPVACTPLPSLPELFSQPPCGYIIPEKDPLAIANLVKRLAKNKEELERHGARGLTQVKDGWDIEKTSLELAQLFLLSQEKFSNPI